MKKESHFLKRYYNALYGRRAIDWYSAKEIPLLKRSFEEEICK